VGSPEQLSDFLFNLEIKTYINSSYLPYAFMGMSGVRTLYMGMPGVRTVYGHVRSKNCIWACPE